MEQIPTNLYDLIVWIFGIGAALFGGFKGWKEYLNSRKEVDVSKANAEIVKAQSEMLTAKQVAQLMLENQEIKKDIVLIKKENEARDDKDERITKALDQLEEKFDEWNRLLFQTVANRTIQFDQSLLKNK